MSTLSSQNGSRISHVCADDFITVDEDIDECRPTAGGVNVGVSEILLHFFKDFWNGLCQRRIFYFILVNFRHVFDDELRYEVPKNAMSISNGVEVGISVCKVGLDEKTILIHFIWVIYLNPLPCPI